MSIVEDSEWYLENRRRRLRRWTLTALVTAHVVATGFLTFSEYIAAGFGSIYFRIFLMMLLPSQACLLGVWGGLGTNRWSWRLLGVAVGMTYLSGFEVISRRPYISETWRGLVSLLITNVVAPVIVIAVVVLIVRRTFAQLRVDHEEPIVENVAQLQFSIRHLMLVTLLVGIAMPVGMGLRPYLGFSSRELAGNGAIDLLAWMTTWAALGKRTPYIRCSITLGIAAFIGFGFDYSYGYPSFSYSTVAVVSLCVFLLASLLVVRGCGYRLVRIKYVIATADK